MPWSNSVIADQLKVMQEDLVRTSELLGSGTLEDWEREYVVSLKNCLGTQVNVLHKALDITKYRDLLKQCITPPG